MEFETNFFLNMSAIPQEHPMGCAVACVAFRCGLSYQAALALFSSSEYAWTRGYFCSEIVEALEFAGLKYTYAKFNSVRHADILIRVGTIAFVDHCIQYPAGHFFIRGSKGWMNPWVTFPMITDVRADFQKELPGKVSYIIYQARSFFTRHH